MTSHPAPKHPVPKQRVEYVVEKVRETFLINSLTYRTAANGKTYIFRTCVTERLNESAAKEMVELLKLLEKPEM